MPALPPGATIINFRLFNGGSTQVPLGKVWVVYFLFDVVNTTSSRTVTLNGNTIINYNNWVTGRLVLQSEDTIAVGSAASLLLTGWEVDE